MVYLFDLLNKFCLPTNVVIGTIAFLNARLQEEIQRTRELSREKLLK